MRYLKYLSALLIIALMLFQVTAAAYEGNGGSTSYTYDEKGSIISIPIRDRNTTSTISPPIERETFFLKITRKIGIYQVPTLFRSLRITELQKIIIRNSIVASVQAYPISYRVVP